MSDDRHNLGVFTPVDASLGDPYSLGSEIALRGGAFVSLDPSGSYPIHTAESVGMFEPRNWRLSRLSGKTRRGIPDRRLELQVVTDWAGPQDPGTGHLGWVDFWTADNRSTRHVDGSGKRVAKQDSHERIVDDEAGAYALAMTLVEQGLEAPGSTGLGESTADPSLPPAPDGVTFTEAGSSSGTGGTVTRAQSSVSVGGVTFVGEAAVAAAQEALRRGGDAASIARAASAAARGQEPPLPPQPGPSSTTRRGGPAPQQVAAAAHPGGYVASDAGKVGLAGTFWTPLAGAEMFKGLEGTSIGTLPMRHDAQVALDPDRRGRFHIVDDDVAEVPEALSGTVVKGWLMPDTSVAGQDTDLPGDVLQLRPVVRIDARSVPPPLPPPPPPPKEEDEEEEPQGLPPTPGKPGPGAGSGQPPPPPTPPPPKRERGDPPPAGEAERLPDPVLEIVTPVENAQAQGRALDGPGVPCPNATARIAVASPGEGSGAKPVRGYPAVQVQGGRLVLGGSGVPASSFVGTVNALAPARGPEDYRDPEWLRDRFVGPGAERLDPNSVDVEADPRVPLDELEAAVPVSAFPAGRQPVVRARREAQRKREEAQQRAAERAEGRIEAREGQIAREEQRLKEDTARQVRDLERQRDAAKGDGNREKRERLADRIRRLREREQRERDRLDRAKARLERSRRLREQDRERRARREAEKKKAEEARRQRLARRAADRQGRSPGGVVIDVTEPDNPQGVGSLPDGTYTTDLDALDRSFGQHNVLTMPTPVFGDAYGPATVADALRLYSTQLGAVREVVTGAFGGPSYLASNVAVVHRNTDGNPPAPSTIGSHWTALAGETVLVPDQAPAVELVSVLEAQQGGRVDALAGAVVTVRREHRIATGGTVTDNRPLVLLEQRLPLGRLATADYVATLDRRFAVDAQAAVTGSALRALSAPGETADLIQWGQVPASVGLAGAPVDLWGWVPADTGHLALSRGLQLTPAVGEAGVVASPYEATANGSHHVLLHSGLTTLAEALNDDNTDPDETATLVLQRDQVRLAWGRADEESDYGVRAGVVAYSDAAGLKFDVIDSTGALYSPVGLRIGEGGVTVTGKLTVTGRLDPTTLEFTNTATDNIPNGTAGLRFDSATNRRPLWKEKGSPYTTEPLAYLSDVTSGAGGGRGIPVGVPIPYHSSTPPTGFLYCDGSAVSRTTYADLFAVIGTTYGSGNGTTTFNLPNIKGRSLMGVDPSGTGEIPTAAAAAKGYATHTLVTSEMPSHGHSVTDPTHLHTIPNTGSGNQSGSGGGGSALPGTVNTSSASTGISLGSTGGDGAHNNVHPVLGVYWHICYQEDTVSPSQSDFADNVFQIHDDGDSSKVVQFQCSGITTATTRTLTIPDASGTIALTSQLPSGAALTKADDTNVTLTLGGTPASALLQATSLTLGWTGTLAVTRGGTGASDATTARTNLGLAIGTNVQAWDQDLTDLAGLTRTRGDLIVGGASAWTDLAIGLSGRYLRSDGTDPSWSTLDMGDAGAGTLAVGRGGTGLASYTAGDLVYASAGTTLSKLAIGSANDVLRVNSGAPAWASLSTMLDTIGSTRGSLLYRGASGWAAIAPGTSGYALVSNGSGADPSYQAVSGSGSGITLDEYDLTSTPTSLTTSEDGRCISNEGYANTGLATVNLPTGLGTTSSSAVTLGVASVNGAGTVDGRVVLEPGANGFFITPGTMYPEPGEEVETLDTHACGLWWGKRDASNTYDQWWPLALTGRHLINGTYASIFGADQGVNAGHNWGYAIAVAAGTVNREGDMNALTFSDTSGTDGQNNEHGYYLEGAGTGGPHGVQENATCPARFGGAHRTYIKFSVNTVAGVTGSDNHWMIGWGANTISTTSANTNFVGIYITKASGGTITSNWRVAGSSTANGGDMGFDLTSDEVYTLVCTWNYEPGGDQRGSLALYASSGVLAYYNVWQYSSTGAPGQSIEARMCCAGARGGSGSGPAIRFFKAGRWSQRAPG